MRYLLMTPWLVLSMLLACEITPSYVEASDIDDALARGHFKTMCVGLKMTQDSIRQYATERLRAVTDSEGIEIANACICEHVAHPTLGWDRAIAEGLKGEQSDARVSCFAKLVADPGLKDRLEAVTKLTQIPAKSARDTLAAIATEAGAPADQRSRALASVGAIEAYREQVINTMLKDDDAAVRAAATKALGGAGRSRKLADKLREAATDKDGAVRGQAMLTLKRIGDSKADDMLCEAMMNDEDAVVRAMAVSAYQGTKRDSAVKCLRKRALAFEPDPEARKTMLKVLGSSPSDEAAKVLCDAIPFWLRSYLKEDTPDRVPGTDIIKTQNDRDWERSYECVARAYRNSGGYSCYARQYAGYWFDKLGGSAFIPDCPRK